METTLKTVSAALKLVDAKKENLRKAFEDLQSHSSSIPSSSSFNLTWSELDSHFTSLQSSLQNQFQLLQQSQHQQQPRLQPPNIPHAQPSKPIPIQAQWRPPNKPLPNPHRSSSALVLNASSSPGSATAKVRPELKFLCEKMDGSRLRNYVAEKYTEWGAIRAELASAFGYATDAAAMVLDAVEGCYWQDGDARRSCVTLLELLVELKPEIREEVKERAKKLTAEWRGKVSLDDVNPMEAFAFLNVVAAFGLVDGFSMEDLVDFAVVAASYEQAVELCRVLGFGDRISDLILKLISKGKQLLAIKFIYEFELNDKFPPVPVLKEFVDESKKLASKVRADGYYSLQSLNEARTKEISALESAIKVIEVHKLETEYPKDNLVKRIEKLEKKQFASAPASKPQQQSKPQKLSGSKRFRNNVTAGLASVPKSNAATRLENDMNSFCEKMDGLGLRNYIGEEWSTIRFKLRDLLLHASDPPMMVLDAMDGFYPRGDRSHIAVRKICVTLLEEFMRLKPQITAEVKGRATKLAAEWKGKLSVDDVYPVEAFGFLCLVGAFGLVNGFSMDDLLDLAAVATKYEQATELYRLLLGNRISDLILKLISMGKQLVAIEFIFEFELTHMFPPVPILNDYVELSKKLAANVRKDKNFSFDSLRETRKKEVRALKSIIKVIKVHKLESVYPKENIRRRIVEIRKKKNSSPASKPQQRSKPQRLSDAPTVLASVPKSNAAVTSASPAFQQSYLRPAGLFPDHPGLGFPGNLMPTQPYYAQPLESHMLAGYFDRQFAYGGCGFLHQDHPPYYPQ